MNIGDAVGWANNWIAVVDDEIGRMRRAGNHNVAMALQSGQKHLRTLIVAARSNGLPAIPESLPARLAHVCDMLSDVDDEAVQGALATLAGRAIILEIVERKNKAARPSGDGKGGG